MEDFAIVANLRDDKGKGASRRLRRTGYVPGILYGADKDPVSIQLEHNDVLKHTELEAFYSHILTLKLPNGSERVVLKDMQRHPYKAQVMHMDFLRVSENEMLTMRVPLHFINEEKCVGVKDHGGVVSHLMTELEVLCLPRNLPEYIEVDILELDVGDALHLADLKIPEGVEIAALASGGDAAQPVVSVQVPRVAAEPEEGDEDGTDDGAEADVDGDKDSDED